MTTSPPRILFISHHGTLSGAPISLLTLMKHFANHRDWEFHMIMRKAGPLRAEYEKLAPTKVYYQHYLDPGDMRPVGDAGPKLSGLDGVKKRIKQWRHEESLRQWVHAYNPDLIYSNTSVNGDILKGLRSKTPVLVHVRELWTTVDLYNKTQRAVFSNPNIRYFAVSEFVKNYLHQEHAIPREHIDIVPGSVEPEQFDALAREKTEDEIRAEMGLPQNAIVIGGIGSVDARKGVDLFVEAAQTILAKPNDKDIRFVWVGAGGMREGMEQKIAKAGLQGKIIFTGERKNPYPYLKIFNIGLMTSRDDPFPRSVMEMAAFGAPIICFREAGGAAEFVADDAGVVLDSLSAEDMAGALTRLMAEPDLSERFSIAGRRKAREEYNTGVIGARAAAFLDSMLARPRNFD